jgi:hypothetical protein
MSGRTGSRLVLLAAVAAAALASVLRLGPDAELLLWCAPALLLVMPLVLGRFVGEDAIDARRLRHASPRPHRVAVKLGLPRRAPRAVSHRGRLLAFRLAERGPPASALALA